VPTHRLFYAIDLPSAALEVLARRQRELAPHVSGARWVAVGALHATLKFLGSVEESRVPALEVLLEEAAARAEPISTRFGPLDAFSSARRAHVLVQTLTADEGAIAHLHALFEAGASVLGFERETRPFRPHVTLARFKPDADVRAALTTDDVLPAESSFVLDSVRLYRSHLGRGGSHYEPIATAMLGARRSRG
jgi:RNA 2',3'-cyclic 3'-phosphodiesterase